MAADTRARANKKTTGVRQCVRYERPGIRTDITERGQVVEATRTVGIDDLHDEVRPRLVHAPVDVQRKLAGCVTRTTLMMSEESTVSYARHCGTHDSRPSTQGVQEGARTTRASRSTRPSPSESSRRNRSAKAGRSRSSSARRYTGARSGTASSVCGVTVAGVEEESLPPRASMSFFFLIFIFVILASVWEDVRLSDNGNMSAVDSRQVWYVLWPSRTTRTSSSAVAIYANQMKPTTQRKGTLIAQHAETAIILPSAGPAPLDRERKSAAFQVG